ncbi:MAG TPA: polyprenyl synthetase family protein [Firmicutes bacterium]|nr:polyprenyl synthetase family protein [Bacillota bacterium]
MLTDWREAIDRYLKAAVTTREKVPHGLKDAMEYALFPGGKRLRALLVIATSAASGGSVYDSIPAAAAVEIVHSYSLVHDDMPEMDDAPLRRGKPSLHKAFGTGTALLVGDALLTLAFEILAELPEEKARYCASILAKCAGPEGMVGGQFLETVQNEEEDLLKRAIEIAMLKTGRLFAAASGIGRIMAVSAREAEGTNLETAMRFGESLGIAYQILDDLQDWARGEDLGKLELPAILPEGECRKRVCDYLGDCFAIAKQFQYPNVLIDYLKAILPRDILSVCYNSD